MLPKQINLTAKEINRMVYITIHSLIKTFVLSFLSLYKHYLGSMKVLTMLGVAAMLVHQIYFQKHINSSIFVELIALVCFYYYGNKLVKSYNRKRKIKNRYRGYIKTYYSESNAKPYSPNRRNYEIQDSSKNNY